MFILCGVTAGAAERPVLLVVGDSLSAAYKIPVEKGWVHLLSERLAARGYAYRVVNASIPGDTTAGGLARLPGELKRYQPAIVVIELGGNDGLQGLPPGQMRANLARMVGLAQKAGAKVLLVGVRMPPNYGPAYTKRFAAVYREVAAAKNVPLVPELMKGVVSHPELMQERGIHPRAAAEPKLLDNVWPVLEPLLKKPNIAGDGNSRSALAARAEVGGALGDDFAADGGAAMRAGFAFAIVHGEADAEVAGSAFGGDEVAQRRAALFDGLGQYFTHGFGDERIAGEADAPGGAARMDAGAPERFVGVDVADAGDDVRIHQEGLDRSAAAAARGV